MPADRKPIDVGCPTCSSPPGVPCSVSGRPHKARVHKAGSPVTDAQIKQLRAEAWTAGDMAQVKLCDRALNGLPRPWNRDGHGTIKARNECARVIANAKAQED